MGLNTLGVIWCYQIVTDGFGWAHQVPSKFRVNLSDTNYQLWYLDRIIGWLRHWLGDSSFSSEDLCLTLVYADPSYVRVIWCCYRLRCRDLIVCLKAHGLNSHATGLSKRKDCLDGGNYSEQLPKCTNYPSQVSWGELNYVTRHCHSK
jgi:hypothetical protein